MITSSGLGRIVLLTHRRIDLRLRSTPVEIWSDVLTQINGCLRFSQPLGKARFLTVSSRTEKKRFRRIAWPSRLTNQTWTRADAWIRSGVHSIEI